MGKFDDLQVLVVEDHEFQRMVCTGLLEDIGVGQVHEASNGFQALDILANENVDVIFLDLSMPEMDGVEFLRRLAPQDYAGSVVLASALQPSLVESVRTLAKVVSIPVLGALEKPVTEEAVSALLEKHLAREAPQSNAAAQPLMEAEEVREGMAALQMVAWYQPKVQFSDGCPVQVEALVRWQHPEHGILAPGLFLNSVGNLGLMDALTEMVAREALEQCAAWRADGLELGVSVNVEAQSLSRPGFAGEFLELVQASGLPPQLVTVELTESALARDLAACIGNLAQLRMNEISVSIDDFGTGYSSMNQLKDMPFSELKIDRGFVSGVTESTSKRALVKGSVQIARELGLKTTAEGVEHWVEWAFMQEAGADLCQGYLSGKPVAADELRDILRDWEQRYAEYKAA